MGDLFADTAGWAAWLNRSEPLHSSAVACVAQTLQRGGQLVTTNYVLAELVALLTSPLRVSRPRQIQLIGAIRTASWVEIVHMDPL